MDSISQQGILVPLTLYEEQDGFIILDGERRWRCSLKLGLDTVPTIIQPKPERLQNIMMMFAIHNARKDWDPLPTAMKLGDLERELTERRGKAPTEATLAASASMSVGEIRRLRRILALPQTEKDRLLQELEKPRHLQILTVDHFLETRRGVDQLVKKGVWPKARAETLVRSIIQKFEDKVEKSTVGPRVLPKIARAYERRDILIEDANRVIERLITSPNYSLERAFQDIAVVPEENRKIESSARNLAQRIEIFVRDHEIASPEALEELQKLSALLLRILKIDA
tara:strand:+ start:1073 stop:1924 length:852 start_codon:yes stop_codon:yes gene_type:complete